MRLIDILQVFKPGMKIRGGDLSFSDGEVEIPDEKALVEFLGAFSPDILMSGDWSILAPDDFFWKSHITPEAYGHNSRCVAVPVIDADEKAKLPFRSEHILTVLRRELDIPDRHDVIVRELWLAMQLLATPESCADFMRRSLVVS